MSDQIKTYANRLKDRLDRIQSILREAQEEREELRFQNQELTKNNWAYKKEAATLNSSQKEYEYLKDENKHLKSIQNDLEVRLIKVLKKTRALSEAFHR